jgi:hypothetical protein
MDERSKSLKCWMQKLSFKLTVQFCWLHDLQHISKYQGGNLNRTVVAGLKEIVEEKKVEKVK